MNVFNLPSSSVTLFIILLIITGTLVEIKADMTIMEQDLELDQPTFKSFTKTDCVDSTIGSVKSSMEYHNNNNNTEAETDSNNTFKITKLPKSTTESIHTIDGLIPNKYTEIVSGLFPNTDDTLQINHYTKRNQLKLVTVKKMIKNDSAPTITLDIIAMKHDNNSPSAVTTLSKSCTTQKYVLSMKEPSHLSKLKCRIKHLNLFSGRCCCFEKDSPLAKVLMCFSLKTNLGKIFCMDIGEDTLAPIHGIKVITLLWVILVHTCLVVFQLSGKYQMISFSFFIKINTYCEIES